MLYLIVSFSPCDRNMNENNQFLVSQLQGMSGFDFIHPSIINTFSIGKQILLHFLTLPESFVIRKLAKSM